MNLASLNFVTVMHIYKHKYNYKQTHLHWFCLTAFKKIIFQIKHIIWKKKKKNIKLLTSLIIIL